MRPDNERTVNRRRRVTCGAMGTPKLVAVCHCIEAKGTAQVRSVRELMASISVNGPTRSAPSTGQGTLQLLHRVATVGSRADGGNGTGVAVWS